MAGQRTSEAREEAGTGAAAAGEEEDARPPEEKPPSFLKGRCLAAFKLVMFAQLALGAAYLASNYGSLFGGDETAATTTLTVAITGVATTLEKLWQHPPETVPEEEALPHCFLNHPEGDDDADDEPPACAGHYTQCPPWGRCRAGALRDCADGDASFAARRFVANDRGDGCAPSPEATALAARVRDVLGDLTAAWACRASGAREVPPGAAPREDEPFPLFGLEQVAENVREASPDGGHGVVASPASLVWLEPVFDPSLVRFGALSGHDAAESELAMGLGEGVAPASLPIPWDCAAKLMLWELLQFTLTLMGQSAWALATFACHKAWSLLTTHPFYTLGALALWKFLALVRRRRRHRAKVRDLFAAVLPLVYDRLAECEGDQGYAALHLRDDIGYELYNESSRDRQFAADHVWGRVVREIRADNRVRKFRRATGGKELEHWDFAVQSKRGWRLRHSPGSGNARGNEVQERVSPRSVGRDP